MESSVTPQSIDPGSVIASAAKIYRDHAGVLLLSAVAVFAVQAVLVLALGWLGALLNLVVNTFYWGMVVELVRDVQDGRLDATVGELFRSVAPVVMPLLGVSILAGLGIVVGFVLLIVPGLYLMTIWSVVAPVTVLERPGVFAAFGRSRELVRGYGWEVFGVILVVIIVSIVASILVGLIASGMSSAGRAAVQWAFNVVTAPLLALLVSTLYFGLRRAHGQERPTAPAGPESPGGWAPPTAPGI
jgi:hypothetical protein